jgi:hypothetical protein
MAGASRLMDDRSRALGLLCVLWIAGCGGAKPPLPDNPDWRFTVQFEVRRGKLLDDTFQVLLPYEAGHINGRPTSDTYLSPTFKSRRELEFDLNDGHARLLEDLAALDAEDLAEPSHFIVPTEARVARLAPVVTNRRFKEIGESRWVDGDTGRSLMLLYFDRPARLHGKGIDVRATEAGYVWVELDWQGVSRAVPRPSHLRLHFYREIPWWSDKVSISVGY